ncbi:MAG: hypothetical protein QM764_22130 [Chitinophagaceae bacterium]
MLKIISAVLLILGFTGCNSKNVKETDAKFSFEPFELEQLKNSKGIQAFVTISSPAPGCSSTPTIEDVNNGKWTYVDNFYSVSQAIKVGIPIVNASGLSNLKVYVRDYSRIKECSSADNEFSLKYGQVIRSVIEIQNYDASIGIDLASLAASGQLGKTRQQFYLYKDGFFNPKIDEIISSVSGKVFDVQNYALYQNVMTQMIKLLGDPGTKFSVNLIGIVKKTIDDEVIKNAPIISYTLSQIANGKKCSDIKAKFNTNQDALDAIETTYRALEVDCNDDAPNDELKLKARKYLQGIKIK